MNFRYQQQSMYKYVVPNSNLIRVEMPKYGPSPYTVAYQQQNYNNPRNPNAQFNHGFSKNVVPPLVQLQATHHNTKPYYNQPRRNNPAPPDYYNVLQQNNPAANYHSSSAFKFKNVAQSSSVQVAVPVSCFSTPGIAGSVLENFESSAIKIKNDYHLTKQSNVPKSELAAKSSLGSANMQQNLFGDSEREKMYLYTGGVDMVMKWHKLLKNQFCYFEVIGAVVSITEGPIKKQKRMLLRDKKGPILQVIYYESSHIDIEDFFVGKMLRCVGRMTGQNVLNAISIRDARNEEVDTLQRLSLICDQAVGRHLNA